MILITLSLKAKILVSFKQTCETLQNCQGLMVKRSKTDTENIQSLVQSELLHCTCRNLNYNMRGGMTIFVFDEQSKKKLETVQLSDNTIKHLLHSRCQQISKKKKRRVVS
jgi:hypothetical protein